jgi:hypothetical protein
MCPAYLYNSPAGVPGDITRTDETNVEPARLIAVSGTFAQAFGIPMKYATGGISQMGVGDAATAFAGVLVREVPAISGNTNQGFDNTVPNPNQINGMAVRGYVSVKCKQGTPARGGTVYVRVEADTGKLVGDFEAVSDTTKSVALTATQATWASDGKDSDNNAELRIAR